MSIYCTFGRKHFCMKLFIVDIKLALITFLDVSSDVKIITAQPGAPGSNTHSLTQHSLRHHVYRVNSIYHTDYYTFQKIDGSLMIRHHPSTHLLYSVRAIHSPLQFCNLSLLWNIYFWSKNSITFGCRTQSKETIVYNVSSCVNEDLVTYSWMPL